MRWEEVINDPSLSDLPYKIELNKWGNIEMSPASNRHGIVEFEVSFFFRTTLPMGRTFVECSINTPEGVKVADVVWCSSEFFAKHGDVTPYPVAPEICVEVLSPSNRAQVMAEKVKLYLGQGAVEVWLVDEQGNIEIYTQSGKQERSSFIDQLPIIPH